MKKKLLDLCRNMVSRGRRVLLILFFSRTRIVVQKVFRTIIIIILYMSTVGPGRERQIRLTIAANR